MMNKLKEILTRGIQRIRELLSLDVKNGKPAIQTLTASQIELLFAIHARVLKGFTYVHDSVKYGQLEYWTFPNSVDRVTDDCDGFAVACRMLVRDAGMDSRLVVCLTETGEGHLVLSVNDWILENRQTKVVRKEDLEAIGYKFLYISGFNPGDKWYKLKGA